MKKYRRRPEGKKGGRKPEGKKLEEDRREEI